MGNILLRGIRHFALALARLGSCSFVALVEVATFAFRVVMAVGASTISANVSDNAVLERALALAAADAFIGSVSARNLHQDGLAVGRAGPVNIAVFARLGNVENNIAKNLFLQ